ncbi:expressed unknown protein [Seminavis robusta]|uniref:Uncharacterized protein n=1 Tax=Seminavis robusta TaxID=568900 RepID=A0A9N8EFX4_9STRA|nr:expressed unknown protein [Seminavis robusta]|eukprot:Sro886_g216171.1  (117) ;mRNA; f:9809-10159
MSAIYFSYSVDQEDSCSYASCFSSGRKTVSLNEAFSVCDQQLCSRQSSISTASTITSAKKTFLAGMGNVPAASTTSLQGRVVVTSSSSRSSRSKRSLRTASTRSVPAESQAAAFFF